MVIYDLQCQAGHRFEGWFPNNEAFLRQQQRGLVACAYCGNKAVSRRPAGGHVMGGRSGGKVVAAAVPTVPAEAKPAADTLQVNVDPVTLMKAVHHYVKNNFKNVGEKFTDQAIQMHRGEIGAEPICGSATETQKERLDDAGVAYTQVPKLPHEFEN